MGLEKDMLQNDKKGLFKSDDENIMYSTGILPLDYANGYWQEIVDNKGEHHIVPFVGIKGGSFVSIIGNTGTGKTTMADQIAYNIIKPFKNSTMHHIDAEKTALRQRIVQLTGADYDDQRIKLSKSHTSIEDVLQMKNEICEMKEKGRDEYKYEIVNRSYTGKSIVAYVPTVFIIDSLPAFNSSNYSTEDLGSNADGMKAAKDVTRFFTDCLHDSWKYNITYLVINHIRPKTDINPYAPAPKGIMMLGPGEMLPRGSVAQFYSDTMFRINAKKSASYTMEDYGFTGMKSQIQLAKSRTNQVGTSFPVAMNGAIGFDPVFTLYEFAEAMGLLNGRNPYIYFNGLEQYKFNRKDFRNMMISNPEFQMEVLRLLKPELEFLIGPKPELLKQENRMEYGSLVIPDEL